MRAVVDTNVFVSAALKQNSIPNIAVFRVAERDTLLKSSATEDELLATLARPHLAALIDDRSRDFLIDLLAGAELVAIAERIAACRDPKDDKFLELAVNGRADLIVTGDLDLLALHPFRGIPIVTPAGFVVDRPQRR